jgi:uncharacterized membrane protein YhfC
VEDALFSCAATIGFDYHLEDAAQLNEKFIFIGVVDKIVLFFEIIEKTLHLFVEKPLQQPEIKTV